MTRRVYIGSFTPPMGTGTGITLADHDPVTGELSDLRLVAETDSPGFLAWHPALRVLYAVNGNRRSVEAFAVTEQGTLTSLGSQPTGGGEPCHLAVDPSGRFVVTADYGGGTLAVFRLDGAGGIGERTTLLRHTEPTGPNAARQETAHVHQARFDASGKWLLVNDLGTDRVYVYRLDLDAGSLRPGATPWAATRPGAGPRHLVSLSHGFVYVADELDSTVGSYTFDDSTGTLEPAQVCASTHDPVGPENYPSEIVTSGDSRFLYVANRGTDVVTTLAVDGPDVTTVADTRTGGTWPRHLAVIGDHLYVANERSDEITIFEVDPGVGVPERVGNSVHVASPGCILADPLDLTDDEADSSSTTGEHHDRQVMGNLR